MPLSDQLPLRTSAAWPAFAKPEPLPTVYGRCTVPAVQYDASRKFWLVADHAIGGVDAVYRDDKPETAFAWRNSIDPAGHPIALIELSESLATSGTLTADVRGKIHPKSGRLLDNPADILQDILQMAGREVSDAEVADFRVMCAGMTVAGMLTAGMTARAQLAELAESVGMLWSPALPGLARRWPVESRAEHEPIYARLGADDLADARSDCGLDALYTVLTIEFDWNWAAGSARHSVTLRSSTADQYGERAATLQAKWLTSAAHAAARGTSWLQAHARPRWSISFEADLEPRIPPGGWFAMDHPLLPISGDFLALSAEWNWSSQRQKITTERAVGPIPTISVGAVGGLFDQPDSGLRVTYANGVATLVIADLNGVPIRDAVVTFDAQKGKTDRTGTVRFTAERGAHSVTVEASGFSSATAEITL